MPGAHRAHKEWTPERLTHCGGDVGVATGRFVTQLLQRFHHPEHGYRSCLGLLSLAKRYGPQRVEAACALALELGAWRTSHILMNNTLAQLRDLKIAGMAFGRGGAALQRSQHGSDLR